MKRYINPKTYLFSHALILILVGFSGLQKAAQYTQFYVLLTHPATLIADFVEIAPDAVFVNAGILMILAILLLHKKGEAYTGMDVAAVGLMGSFAFLGKNPVNTFPFLIGGWLYHRINHRSFVSLVPTLLFASSLAPIVTDLMFVRLSFGPWSIFISVVTGIILGYGSIILSHATRQYQQGFSLYNVGLATGMISTLYIALMRSLGYPFSTQLIWGTQHQTKIRIVFAILLLITFVFMFLSPGNPTTGLPRLWSYDQPGPIDAWQKSNAFSVYLNLAMLMMASMLLLWLIKAPLNGGTLCGILTITYFGAAGKNLRNIIPIFLGVWLGSLIKIWNINDPTTILILLFGTSLAPFAQVYGSWAGVLAGFMLSSLALSISSLTDGATLYGTGFSAGVSAMILHPLIDHLYHGHKRVKHHIKKKKSR